MVVKDCKCIVVLGASKKVGVTTLVHSVSKTLSKDQEVLVIDADKDSKRNLACSFEVLDEPKTLNSIISHLDLDPIILRGYLSVNGGNVGLMEMNGSWSVCEQLPDVIKALSHSYEYIIIDCGSEISDLVKSLLKVGNKLIIVSKSDSKSSSAIKMLMRQVESLGLNKRKVSIVNLEPSTVENISRELIELSSGDKLINSDNSQTSDNKIKYKSDVLNKLSSSKEIKKLIDGQNVCNADRSCLKQKIECAVNDILDNDSDNQIRDRKIFIKKIVDEAIGLGPLEKYMSDPEVTEIMVNSVDEIYIEREGKIERAEASFTDEKYLFSVIERIVAPIGRRIDESSPIVDARLPDGSRVHVIIPPLSLNGPTITIRKFRNDAILIDDLISFGTLNDEMADFLETCVKQRVNILISGGTGSGKTTLLNVLSSFVLPNERIITIEDSAELKLNQPHVVRLESRPKNIEGRGEVAIRDLVKASLRMRPDRIIVGEVRGAEALDMLQSMNTGHDGSLTTIHANNCRDSIARLETLVMFSGFDLPVRAIREQIASAINVVIQLKRLKDGSRKIVSISEITGMEGQVITMQELFVFDDNEFISTGLRPYIFE